MTSMQQVLSLYRIGEHDRALQVLDGLPPSPQRSKLSINLLIKRRARGDLDRAQSLAQDWSQKQPGNPEPLQRLAEILLFKGELNRAADVVERLNRAAPGHPVALSLKGVVAQLQGESEQAFSSYLETERSIPEHRDSAQLRALLRMYETASGNYPGSPGRDDIRLLDEPGLASRLESALLDWQTSAEEQPGESFSRERRAFGNAWYNLGCLAMADFDRCQESIRHFEKAIELDPDHELARTNRVFAMNYSTEHSPEEIAQAHRQFGKWLVDKTASSEGGSIRRGDRRRLRIAYLSSDFRQHSVAHFILPVLQQHDADSFEVHLFHTDPRSDEITRKMMETGALYHQAAHLNDDDLAALVRRHEIDILVDLNGLTQGHRLSLLARRIAPLQLSWIGYPNTTGLPTMDYRLVDGVTDPQGDADAWCTEQLYRMPGGFSVFGNSGELPEVGEAPCTRNGYVTFGSFNNMAKLNRPLVALWAKVLRGVPGSKLLIKNIALSSQRPRKRLLEAFVEEGVEASRVEFQGKVAEQSGHLRFFQKVDLCFDSFPYNGTTTNCDSLLMGVPVITLKGLDHRSRVGASQLTRLGLEKWIADDAEAFVSKATDLAMDQEALVEWRGRLRDKLLNSPLMDAESFTRQLEQACLAMWSAE